MTKLFYENQYIREFTAEIIEINEKGSDFHIVLNETYFYPEGGGQPSDIGHIDSIPVTYVYEENEKIYHVLTRKPNKIKRVKCTIDWEVRYDHMQQHLGQHILSASFLEMINGRTVNFHLGKEYCTIDIEGMIQAPAIETSLKRANERICENILVEFLFPTKAELKKLGIKKALPKTDAPLRIVKIEDWDINPCCGLHPRSTIEVQLLKVIKWEKHKDNTRIYFLAGKRAVSDSILKDEFSKNVCKTLQCSEEQAFAKIEKLSKDYSQIVSENRFLQAKVAEYEAANMVRESAVVKNITVVSAIFDDRDSKSAQLLATKITESTEAVVIFGVKTVENCSLLCMCSKSLKKLNMNNLLKDAITLLDGKGGGSPFSAQGAGKSKNNLDSTVDYATNKIMREIEGK